MPENLKFISTVRRSAVLLLIFLFFLIPSMVMATGEDDSYDIEQRIIYTAPKINAGSNTGDFSYSFPIAAPLGEIDFPFLYVYRPGKIICHFFSLPHLVPLMNRRFTPA